MKFQTQSDNMDLSPSMSALAKEKMAKLDKHFRDYDPELIHARIVMNTAPVDKFAVKIRLVVNGEEFFTDETSFSLEHALILAVEELDRQLEKDKSKHHAERKWEDQREAKRLTPEELEKEAAPDDADTSDSATS